MKWVLNVVAILLILIGLVWFLQGINVLPGSFMSGKALYAFLGIGVDIVGAVILFFTNRRKVTK